MPFGLDMYYNLLIFFFLICLSLKFFDICVFRIICISIQERPELKLVSHRRKVALIGRPVHAIEGLVVATGLSPLIECSVVTGDPGLISIFVERWHRETNTFHLPVGELTITLDDVSSLLHLPISGTFHSFHALYVDEAVFLLMELLEVFGEEARVETT